MSADEGSLRALVIVANVIGFVYNVPQVILTIRTKSANDISLVFLSMRLLSAVLWLIYSGILWSPDVFLSWVITGGSSGVLLYYKLVYSTRDQIWKEFVCKRSENTPIELKDDAGPSEVVTN